MSNVPQRIGNYQLERQIGKGGFSEVWLARHRSLENRLIAVKLLLSQDHEWVDRFSREANITSRLRHEHIIQIFDHGYQAPFYYTIMEYVAGGALRTLIKPRQPLALDLALRIFREAGIALDYAHSHGVIHRDVSPGNILVEQETGRVVLTDFGIAREAGRTGMTTISKVMGTPGYLSPEHASSATSVTHLSDLYSLGVVLYEMITGMLPWDHYPGLLDSAGGPFTAPPALKDRGVQGLPPDVDRVLQTMLAIDPAKRYPSAHAAIGDLDQVLARHTGPTMVVGAADKAQVVGVAPAGSAQLIPARAVEQHQVEQVLGPDLIKGPMQKARERAEQLSQQSELVALLNQWSKAGPFRRPLLGRQAAFHRATSTNVYFYTLKVLYETREPIKTTEEPDHKALPVQREREQDRWGVALPPPKDFEAEAGGTVTLPGSTQVQTCGECQGHGRKACPRCKGQARVLVSRDTLKPAQQQAAARASAPAGGAAASATTTTAAPPPAQVLVPCPQCSGTGSLKCDRCEGVGRLMLRKTTAWRRRPASLTANDDLPRIDEAWLQRACKLTTIYQERQIGDVRAEWKLVPGAANLINKALADANADTRIAMSELTIAFIPVTEIIFDLGERSAKPAAAPAKSGPPAPADESGLYSWHIFGFERELPKDWRFLVWDRVLMYIFGLLALILLLILLASLLLR